MVGVEGIEPPHNWVETSDTVLYVILPLSFSNHIILKLNESQEKYSTSAIALLTSFVQSATLTLKFPLGGTLIKSQS